MFIKIILIIIFVFLFALCFCIGVSKQKSIYDKILEDREQVEYLLKFKKEKEDDGKRVD